MKLIVGAAAICAVVLVSGLRNDHQWGDDFAQYIAHAHNLVNGKSYIDTGHLNAVSVVKAPRAYPPLTPLLLAPIVKWRGLDWRWLKLPQVVGALIAIVAWGAMARPYLGDGPAALLTLAIGLHPITRLWSDFVMSDLIFLAEMAVVFFALERWIDRRAPNDTRWRRGAAIGAVIGAAILTRTVGVMLLPVVPAIEWIRTRRLSGLSVAAIGVAVAMTAASFVWLPLPAAYLDDQSTGTVTLRMWRWGQWYATDLVGMLPGIGEERARALFSWARHAAGYPEVWPVVATRVEVAIATPIIACVTAMVVAGFARKGPWRSFDLFAPPFVLYLATYWAYDARYVFPVLPMIYFYFLSGAERLVPAIGRTAVTTICLVAIAANSTIVPWREYSPGVASPAAQRFLTFVRESTPPDAVIAFLHPRALALLTGRKSYATTFLSDEERAAALQRGAATYAAAAPMAADDTRGFVDRHPERFHRIYSADGFELFEILSSKH
jgi:uncharacterized protein YqgC (DUF456 family)